MVTLFSTQDTPNPVQQVDHVAAVHAQGVHPKEVPDRGRLARLLRDPRRRLALLQRLRETLGRYSVPSRREIHLI